MASISVHKLALLLSSSYTIVRAQYDPIANFCRLLDHQSTIIDGTLYIDGGREIYTNYGSDGSDMGPHVTGLNEYLLTVDMTTSWDSTNIPIKKFPKTLGVPYLTRGALYPDPSGSNKFFLFGGTVATDNLTFPGYQQPQPDAKSLWSYDAGSNAWNAFDMSSFGLIRPASGASAFVEDKGLAFYFNGEQDLGSSSTSTVLNNTGGTTEFISGMVVLDLLNQTARNVSTFGVSNLARVRGQMVHVPLAGSDGLLVLLGGGQKATNNVQHDWKGTLVTFNSVPVLDVGSLSASTGDGNWYSQLTSGNIPAPRVDPCVVAAPAPDNSSYNIYMYGGRDGVNAYYDELWILTLPSFQWVLAYQGDTPRYSMTCHLVGNRQMVMVGGSNISKIADSCDSETQGLGVLDLTTLTWGNAYDAKAAPYEVPMPVVNLVGGTTVGGANVTKPLSGFANKDFAALFANSSTTASSTTTTRPSTAGNSGTSSSTSSSNSNSAGSNSTDVPSPQHKVKAGAIAGGVVGGLLGFGLIAAAAFLFCVRSRRRQQIQETVAAYGPVDELDSAGIHQLAGNGAGVHQIDDSARYPVYEVPGSLPPVYEKDAPMVSTRSITTSRSDDNLISHRDSAPAELDGSEVERDESTDVRDKN